MIKRIDVFATNSKTELAIEDFLKKINPTVYWAVHSPRMLKKSKHEYTQLSNASASSDTEARRLHGDTGSDLEKLMLDHLQKHPITLEESEAILLEDDLDFRAVGQNPRVYLDSQKKRLTQMIEQKFAALRIPSVFVLYAAPEVEAWFIADWNNSFASYLPPIVSAKFQIIVREEILSTCESNNIEAYSLAENNKLRERLAVILGNAVIDLVNDGLLDDGTVAADRERYSYNPGKRGGSLLSSIYPFEVAKMCKLFFEPTYLELQQL